MKDSMDNSKKLSCRIKKELKVVHEFVKLADPVSLGAFSDDEYSTTDIEIYKLLKSKLSVEIIALTLSSGKTSTSHSRIIAEEIVEWWNEQHNK